MNLTQKEQLIKFANKNNGVLLSRHATELGISRAVIKELSDEGLITLIQHGVYVVEDGYADDFFLTGEKFKKGVFSHETALYLWEFSDRAPTETTMTFKFVKEYIKRPFDVPFFISHSLFII